MPSLHNPVLVSSWVRNKCELNNFLGILIYIKLNLNCDDYKIKITLNIQNHLLNIFKMLNMIIACKKELQVFQKKMDFEHRVIIIF